MSRQPWLHDLQIAVDGPATVLTTKDGSIGGGATGWYVDDRRLLKGLILTLDAQQPTPVAASATGSRSQFWAAARHLGDAGPDPTVEVHQHLRLCGHELNIEVTITSRAQSPVITELCLDLVADATNLATIKGGGDPCPPVDVTLEQNIGWADNRHSTTVRCQPTAATTDGDDRAGIRLTWPLKIDHGQHATITLKMHATRTNESAFDADAGSVECDWNDLLAEDDNEWEALVRTNLTDLAHLLQRDPEASEDIFVGAGTPWYLTLFGRDAI